MTNSKLLIRRNPKPFEDLNDLNNDLTKMNGYNFNSTIINKAGISNYHNKVLSKLSSSNLRKYSDITGIELKKLLENTVNSISHFLFSNGVTSGKGYGRTYSYPNSKSFIKLFTRDIKVFCPNCFKENLPRKYYYWLSHITICPIHKTILRKASKSKRKLYKGKIIPTEYHKFHYILFEMFGISKDWSPPIPDISEYQFSNLKPIEFFYFLNLLANKKIFWGDKELLYKNRNNPSGLNSILISIIKMLFSNPDSVQEYFEEIAETNWKTGKPHTILGGLGEIYTNLLKFNDDGKITPLILELRKFIKDKYMFNKKSNYSYLSKRDLYLLFNLKMKKKDSQIDFSSINQIVSWDEAELIIKDSNNSALIIDKLVTLWSAPTPQIQELINNHKLWASGYYPELTQYSTDLDIKKFPFIYESNVGIHKTYSPNSYWIKSNLACQIIRADLSTLFRLVADGYISYSINFRKYGENRYYLSGKDCIKFNKHNLFWPYSNLILINQLEDAFSISQIKVKSIINQYPGYLRTKDHGPESIFGQGFYANTVALDIALMISLQEFIKSFQLNENLLLSFYTRSQIKCNNKYYYAPEIMDKLGSQTIRLANAMDYFIKNEISEYIVNEIILNYEKFNNGYILLKELSLICRNTQSKKHNFRYS